VLDNKQLLAGVMRESVAALRTKRETAMHETPFNTHKNIYDVIQLYYII